MDKVAVYDHLTIAVLEVGKVRRKDLLLNFRGFWARWNGGHTTVSDPVLFGRRHKGRRHKERDSVPAHTSALRNWPTWKALNCDAMPKLQPRPSTLLPGAYTPVPLEDTENNDEPFCDFALIQDRCLFVFRLDLPPQGSRG